MSGRMLEPGTPVHVRLVKSSGGDLEYPAEVVSDDGTHVVVHGPWAEPEARDLGFVRFEPDDVFTEHYWRDRWYSIKEVRDARGERKGWYCDVARPVHVEGSLLSSEDLELDLWVSADGRTILRVDEDEFAQSGLAETDPIAAAEARHALDELERLAADGFSDVGPRGRASGTMNHKKAKAPFPPGSVVLITGIMGAGKSTVAQLLAERLPKAAHIRGDAFRRMIVSGRVDMVPSAGPEAIAQLHLRYDLAAAVADGYAGAGLTAVYQDIVLGEDLARAADRLRTRPLYVVVLAPRPEVVLRRAETRPKLGGYGAWTVDALDRMLRETPRFGLWMDTSEQTATQTVDQIVRRADDARVR